MREDPSQKKTTRRDVLKLAGAAALGAAGSAALGAPRVLAAGSGNTIGMYFSPERALDTRGSAKIGHGGETKVGPYPYPGSTTFTWEDYYGIIGNITAVSQTGAGFSQSGHLTHFSSRRPQFPTSISLAHPELWRTSSCVGLDPPRFLLGR